MQKRTGDASKIVIFRKILKKMYFEREREWGEGQREGEKQIPAEWGARLGLHPGIMM